MAPKGYYGVRLGHRPGVYNTWDDCQAQTKGFPGAAFQKFATADQANNFVRGEVPSSTGATTSNLENPKSTKYDSKGKKRVASLMDAPIENESSMSVVYSDGACKGNGKPGSVAGIGVWWGHDDPRNIAERCPGDQTNNRAELIAMLRVLETTPITKKPLIIKTDSKYSINCLQEWLPGWLRRGWKNSKDEAVKNAGIIRLISAHLDRRAQQGQRVRLSYVKGHSGDIGNDGADAQANLGTHLPITPERDWDADERRIRQKIATNAPPSPFQTTIVIEDEDDGGASLAIVPSVPSVPRSIPEEPVKRQRVEKPNQASEAGPSRSKGASANVQSSTALARPTTPPRSPEKRSNLFASIQSALAEPNEMPAEITQPSKPPAPPMTPQKLNRLNLINGALGSGSVNEGANSKGQSSASNRPEGPTSPQFPTSSKPLRLKPSPTSPSQPPEAKSPSQSRRTEVPISTGIPQTPPSDPKYPLRVLYASPILLPVKAEEINPNDYADCLLSDSDLAFELED